MGTVSKIEWTERTWNPTVGCTKISPGCKHCYAETMAKRLQAMGAPGYTDGFAFKVMPERLKEPLQRKKPTTWFVNSMSDLFHEAAPFDYIAEVFRVMAACPQHTFQVLTKRADIMARFCSQHRVSQNVWLGVSVEDCKYGVPRIDVLRDIKVETRFLSIEPLLENVGTLNLRGIHWVIVGGESGHGARIMRPEWVANIQEQCEEAGVSFFFKQWGAWGADGKLRDKKANGRVFRGQVWDAAPVPAVQRCPQLGLVF